MDCFASARNDALLVESSRGSTRVSRIALRSIRATVLESRRRQENRMKRYLGDRTIDGVKVTVDGVPLDPRLQ